MSQQVNETLSQRGQQYGDFEVMAALSQQIRALFMSAMQQHNPDMAQVFRPYMVEAVQMFSTKLARIALGNAFNPDSWHDIAGYATLVENKVHEELKRGQEAYEAQLAQLQEEARKVDGTEAAQAQGVDLVGAAPKAGESSLVDMDAHSHPAEADTVNRGPVTLDAAPQAVSRTGDPMDYQPAQPAPDRSGNI